MSVETILTRDLNSKRVHRRYVTESGALASLEGDNLDEAGEYEVLDSLDGIDEEDLCGNCFAKTGQDQQTG